MILLKYLNWVTQASGKWKTELINRWQRINKYFKGQDVEWTLDQVNQWIRGSRYSEFLNCFKRVNDGKQFSRLTPTILSKWELIRSAAPVLYHDIQELKGAQKGLWFIERVRTKMPLHDVWKFLQSAFNRHDEIFQRIFINSPKEI